MTGTDTPKIALQPAYPAVILVNPQMGENIGACARAMLNCGLSELRLVAPRDGWPSEAASRMSSGALDIMPEVKVYNTLTEAAHDCHHLYATTARPREMVKPVLSADKAALEIADQVKDAQKVGLVFGGERSGLANDDVAACHTIITIPLNPGFSSLNLAQAVLLVTYELSKTQFGTLLESYETGKSEIATQDEVDGFISRLDHELEAHHFYRDEGLKPTMQMNIRNMITRARMTDQEIRTFHGMLSALLDKKGPKT
ncbi:MAG: RNA methyltransferase [Pseudobdellovibrionaceae bacterium]